MAVFRAQLIGPLTCRKYEVHGEFREVMRELAEEPAAPPGHAVSRSFSVTTLERWYYAFKKHGIEGLKPRSRVSGIAKGLDDPARAL